MLADDKARRQTYRAQSHRLWVARELITCPILAVAGESPRHRPHLKL
jgi:hypothetical protein